jgi:hypothetical protein
MANDECKALALDALKEASERLFGISGLLNNGATDDEAEAAYMLSYRGNICKAIDALEDAAWKDSSDVADDEPEAWWPNRDEIGVLVEYYYYIDASAGIAPGLNSSNYRAIERAKASDGLLFETRAEAEEWLANNKQESPTVTEWLGDKSDHVSPDPAESKLPAPAHTRSHRWAVRYDGKICQRHAVDPTTGRDEVPPSFWSQLASEGRTFAKRRDARRWKREQAASEVTP